MNFETTCHESAVYSSNKVFLQYKEFILLCSFFFGLLLFICWLRHRVEMDQFKKAAQEAMSKAKVPSGGGSGMGKAIGSAVVAAGALGALAYGGYHSMVTS